MKKIVRKILVIFLILVCISCTIVYGASVELMEESEIFYAEHQILVDSISIISNIIQIVVVILVVMIPITIIYKNVKLRKSSVDKRKDDRNKYIVKMLKKEELFFLLNIIIMYLVSKAKTFTGNGVKDILVLNIFITVVSMINIIRLSIKLLKK